MSVSVKVIYGGEMTGGRMLGICDEPGSSFGWLMGKHPDGQWVTLANIPTEMAVIREAAERNAVIAGGKR